MAYGEELIFRLPICMFPRQKFALLLIGAVMYGVTHLFFSRYDVCSKIVLGLLFGISVIWTKNVYVAIMMHTAYNVILVFFGGLDCTNLQKK